MKPLSIQSVGPVPAIEAMHAVALYDKDGRVCHLHHAVTFVGATRKTPQEHEGNARAYAERMGHKPADLQALHVPDFRPFAGQYRVDLKAKALVAVPAARGDKK